ncbi:MAG: homocysteine S-methyltransferase family protein [Lachnospiraceae bacterium]|nr:homocysteine S-methyltransferase family protein [Lachnospiraceae bacterium]
MNRVTLLDGAVGTSLWAKSDGDRSPVWQYNITKQDIVKELLGEYIDAGSEMLLSNTFGINRPIAERFSYNVSDVVKNAMELLNEVAGSRKTLLGEKVQTIFSSGPLSQMLEPYGDLEEDECFEIYDELVKAAVAEKPDYIWFQTFMDLNMMEIAVRAASQYDVPIFCTLSFTEVGKTMFGNSPEDMVETLAPYEKVKAVGLNCSVGPESGVAIIKSFHECTELPLIFKPNAGIPITGSGGKSEIRFDAETFAKDSLPALDYGVKYIGGCCGSDPSYIKVLKEVIENG